MGPCDFFPQKKKPWDLLGSVFCVFLFFLRLSWEECATFRLSFFFFAFELGGMVFFFGGGRIKTFLAGKTGDTSQERQLM